MIEGQRPCARGHTSERTKDGRCKECRDLTHKLWRENNREFMREYSQKYRNKNRERIREYNRYYAAARRTRSNINMERDDAQAG